MTEWPDLVPHLPWLSDIRGRYALFFGAQLLLLVVFFLALGRVKEGTATNTKTLLYRALVIAPGHRLAGLAHRPRA